MTTDNDKLKPRTIGKCPFCVGDGCCYCDHTGRINITDGAFAVFKTIEEAEAHDPETSLFDLKLISNTHNR